MRVILAGQSTRQGNEDLYRSVRLLHFTAAALPVIRHYECMVMDPLADVRSFDDMSAARLEGDPAAGDYRRRKGFHSAAVLLLQEAAKAAIWNDRDPLVWPALYSFRHYVELELKYLVRGFPELGLGTPPRPIGSERCGLPSPGVSVDVSGGKIVNHSMYLSARSPSSKLSIRLATDFDMQLREPDSRR